MRREPCARSASSHCPYSGAEQQAQREVWGQTLVELGQPYPELLVLDGDLANSTRAELFAEAFPDRFLQMGIAEQNMMGVAAGLAGVGFVPWLSFAVFLPTGRSTSCAWWSRSRS